MALTIDLEGRTAFVSGVTRGIGAGVARALARAGCDVVGCGLSPENGEDAREFVGAIEALGRKGCYFEGDLSRKGTAEELMRRTAEQFPGLDVLVSNAARNVFKGAEACTDEDWDYCLELGLASHWRLARAALPLLRKGETGSIIVMGSNHAFSTIPGCFPYNVAKAGLLGLVQSLAIEWGPDIRCVGIAPGFVDTPGNEEWFDSFPDPAVERERTARSHPVGRIGTVEEIGALCAFLASPHGGFISGTTLLADGGRSALMQD